MSDPHGNRFAAFNFLLESAGYETFYTQARSFLELVRRIADTDPDLVFSAVSHTKDGERVNIHKALEFLNIPFVGSSAEVLDLALAKHRLKERWIERSIATPDFFIVEKGELELPALERALDQADRSPFLVKPAAEGNSRGIREENIVSDRYGLEKRIRALSAEYGTLLVERFLGFAPDCREFTIALVGNGSGRILAPAEIVLPADRLIRLVKTEDKETGRAAAVPIVEDFLRNRVAAAAAAAFDAAGIRDYGRCDMIQAYGTLYAIEINGQPMIPDAWFEVCCGSAGLSADKYPKAIIRAAVDRHYNQLRRTK